MEAFGDEARLKAQCACTVQVCSSCERFEDRSFFSPSAGPRGPRSDRAFARDRTRAGAPCNSRRRDNCLNGEKSGSEPRPPRGAAAGGPAGPGARRVRESGRRHPACRPMHRGRIGHQRSGHAVARWQTNGIHVAFIAIKLYTHRSITVAARSGHGSGPPPNPDCLQLHYPRPIGSRVYGLAHSTLYPIQPDARSTLAATSRGRLCCGT
jgi:hypothetical protein